MKTVAELNAIRAQALAQIALRHANPDADAVKPSCKRNVLVCGGTGCTSSHSEQII